MEFNWIAPFVAALIPLLLGFVWYHPQVFGRTWMTAAGMTDEKMRSGNRILTFGLTYLIGLLVAVTLMPITIHQMAIFSLLAEEPGMQDPQSEIGRFLSDFMGKYGDNFRSFKHGALHGTITGIFLASSIVGFNALFERKGFRYFAVNAGFWIVCMAIMGGVVCGWR